MKKVISSLLFVIFILTLIPVGSVCAVNNTFTFDGLTISGDIAEEDIKYENGKLILGKEGNWGTYNNVTLSGTAPDGHYFIVRNNVTAYITLDNLHLTGNIVAFAVGSNATVLLYLKGSNTLIGKYGSGLFVNYDAIVTIAQVPPKPGGNTEDIKGFLYASGGKKSPGICAARQDWQDGTHSYSQLRIQSGTVTAIGGRQAAGIGGGDLQTGGKINIYGGVVTAIGNRGAGIGGGNASENGGDIYISGGIVNAYSTEAGAGIGGGDDDSDGGKIYIAGGFINAVGAGSAAGIGGGNNGTSGDIIIQGGTVIATGGIGGAGIGGGKHNNNDGGNIDNIRIYGGTIFANGNGGEDIGLGQGGRKSGNVFISDYIANSAVFMRNNSIMSTTGSSNNYKRISSRSYFDMSKFGIELSALYPEVAPDIMPTLPDGVTGPNDDWLKKFWNNQINHWKSADNVGAYLQPRTVTYHKLGSGSETLTQTQHKGTVGEIMDGSIFSRPGFSFDTWRTSLPEGSEYTPGDDYTFNNNLNLYATWQISEYFIKYQLDGGTVSNSNPTGYKITDDDIKLNNPTKEGYTFAGWSGTGITGISTEVIIPTGSTGNREYTANWTPNTYTVCYDANGGTGTMQNSVFTYDTAGNLQGNRFTRSGYSFAGWAATYYGDVIYSDEQSVINLTESGEVTLYAQWIMADYNITYDLGGGTVSNSNPTGYKVTDDEIKLNNPTKEGYTFAGWSGTEITGISTEVIIPTGSTGNREYTANWTPNTYTVCYDANGGTGTMQNSVFTYDTAGNLQANRFTRSGYSFAGWAATYYGDVIYSDEQSVINLAECGEVTLYAKWMTVDYTITYNLDGGTVSNSNPTGYKIIDDEIKLNNPTKEGYTFAGWSGTEITGTSAEVIIPAGSTGNREYIANWTAKDTEDESSGKDNPKTGDRSQLFMWLLCGALAVGIAGLVLFGKRRKMYKS